MDNLNLIYEKYKSRDLIITGDLNARVGNFVCSNSAITYQTNPDISVNPNGNKLLDWLTQHQDMIIVNGVNYCNRNFDSKFTFFRGNVRSQNDITLTNRIDKMNSLKIEEKLIFSDHCPISITCTTSLSTPLEFVLECAVNTLY